MRSINDGLHMTGYEIDQQMLRKSDQAREFSVRYQFPNNTMHAISMRWCCFLTWRQHQGFCHPACLIYILVEKLQDN